MADRVQTRSGSAKTGPKANVFDKKAGRVEPPGKKVYTREELLAMKRDALRALCRKIGVAQSGSDKDIAERLAAEFEKKIGEGKGAEVEIMDMDSDIYYAFAFTGFPPDANEAEAVHFIQVNVREFLGEFHVQVVGSNTAKGQIALTFLESEGEALKAKISEFQERFVHNGHALSAIGVHTDELPTFKLPEGLAPPLPGYQGPRPVDDLSLFVFKDFYKKESDYEVFDWAKEYVHDYLSADFPIEVLGVHGDRVGVRVPR